MVTFQIHPTTLSRLALHTKNAVERKLVFQHKSGVIIERIKHVDHQAKTSHGAYESGCHKNVKTK